MTIPCDEDEHGRRRARSLFDRALIPRTRRNTMSPIRSATADRDGTLGHMRPPPLVRQRTDWRPTRSASSPRGIPMSVMPISRVPRSCVS